MANTQVANTAAQLSGAAVSVDGAKIATLTLTNAQVKAGPTTGVYQIVATVGGKLLVPIWVAFIGDFAAGAYTNVKSLGTAAKVGIELNNGSGLGTAYLINNATDSISDFHDFFTTAQKSIAMLNVLHRVSVTAVKTTGIFQSSANTVGSIVVRFNNDGLGDFTGGNAANTLKIVLGYVEVTV